MKQALRRTCGVAALASVAILAAGAQAGVPLTQMINDRFTNASSQHKTAVEPDTFSFGSRMVTVAQVGRFFNGGASGIGYATFDGNVIVEGVLPGITFQDGSGSPYERVSDPSIAYDAKHDVWLASTLPLTVGVIAPDVLTSRSTNGGVTWGNPIQVVHGRIIGGDLDKNWIACDNTPASPFYGNCYTTWDDFSNGNRLYVSTSIDGGLTWGDPKQTANSATGLGGQPVVQPNGTVILPAANAIETEIIAFRSTNGGASWSNSVSVSPVSDHLVAGNLRTSPLPSAEIDAAGKVYVVWQDCRFRVGCPANDIVMSTSTDGLSWSHVARIPIDPVASGVDHFIPGIAVDPATSGATAKLGLTYYFYRSAHCGGHSACHLEVGYIQSNSGGATWSHPTDVAGPFGVALIADTSQGRMVGDYISTSWLGGKAVGAFAVARPPSSAAFDEEIDVPMGGLIPAPGGFVNTSAGDQPVPGAVPDYPSPTAPLRVR